jgi:SAM-dependent methyltransferase
VEQLPDWAPEDVDLSTPSVARVYDYYLGGTHNFEVDREFARKVLALYPDGRRIGQANRAFLHRALRYLLGQGVRQFIDLGAGIPTMANVHETVQAEAPGARVVYVDHDPVAVAHSELILRGNDGTRVLRADLRDPASVLDSAEVGGWLDRSQPVGVLMLAVLHFVSEDEQPEQLLRQYRDRLASGSYLVVSHAAPVERPAEAEQVAELYQKRADPLTYRSSARVEELFDGWQLVPPGVVWMPQWRPDQPDETGSDPATFGGVAAVGRKP